MSKKAHNKLFSHIDKDGYGCNVLLEALPVTYDATNVNYDKINEVVKKYILSEDYKNYEFTYITDISVNEEVAELIENTEELKNNIKLFDHHPTALWLNKYSWAFVSVEYNGEKTCGTELLFYNLQSLHERYMFKDIFENLKTFVRTVKLYDTWLWHDKYNDIKPKKSNDLFLMLGSERWVKAIKKSQYDIDAVLEEHKLFLNLEQEKIDRYIKNRNEELFLKDIKGYKVGIVFASKFQSELGNKLSEMHPECDLIAMIGYKRVSYRTVKEGIDCGKFAELFGGGGHPKSSGSNISEFARMNYIESIFSK